jgi:UDPglucose 6-dehydrogenase
VTAIAVIGSWHNAFVTAGCLASWGHDVCLVSSRYELPLDEPGLDSLLKKVRRTPPETVPIPWFAEDVSLDAAGAPDTTALMKLIGMWYVQEERIIISSQVPLGFCQHVERTLYKRVVYIPENMRLGAAVEGFLHPDRLIIGAALEEDRTWAHGLFPAFFTRAPVIKTDLNTAEMCKHATNAFLATCVSFANEVAALGGPYGVDSDTVARALRADGRIGPRAYVKAGAGFGGGNLERDVRALQDLGPTMATPLLNAVLAVNGRAPRPDVTPHEAHIRCHI